MRSCVLATLIALALFHPSDASAQAETETLIRGDVDNGFVIAPDFKFTDVDGRFSNLAGAYGGWVINRKLLLGGGLYTLTNGPDPMGMTYGGGVVEYFVNSGSLVNFSVRGLVGGGSATLGGPFDDFPIDLRRFGDFHVNLPGFGRGSLNSLFNRFRGSFPDRDFPFFDLNQSADFFVAEPEANVMLNVTERIRLSFGGGYRFIGGASRLNERLDGFTANAALKLSFF